MEKFKVFVAGTSGAGKTAFLASMYNRMSAELQELGFYLETSSICANNLIKKYQELTNPDKPWPPGTDNVTEWDFSCRSFEKQQTLFNFSYLDFPGGYITDATNNQKAQDFDVGQKVKDANSLLFLLDGQKVYYFMMDINPPVGHTLHADIDFLVSLAMRTERYAPIHFALTKWDILEEKFSLNDIKIKLFTIHNFASMVNTRKNAGLPTRLIPVSAFGKGLADLDSAGHMIKKKSNFVPVPFQVEMSIACTLIDGFRVAHQEVKKRELEANTDKIVFLAIFFRFITFIFKVLGFGARNLDEALPGPYRLGTKACAVLLTSATRRLELRTEELEIEIDRVKSRITKQESALDTAIRKCDLLSLQLERNFPASNLTML